jgi:signal transduction histidine kinase
MHDVVAHHMSMIAVQAETAPYRVAGLPESAREEFAALSQAAREALTDMRRLLGVLRSEQATERIPQPGLADVPALVEGTRRAGAEVGLTMPRFTGDVAPVVGLTAYRIVQEALSNAARHAPGAAIQVAVEREAGIVRVRIDNDAPGAGLSRGGRGCLPGEPGDGGHGLAGMRERVALLGGQLGAGPQADGGFGVRAELPARLTVECYVADEGHWHAGAS